jgi:hypothetical protein
MDNSAVVLARLKTEVEALVTAGTLDTSFTVADNDLIPIDVPCIIIKSIDSDPKMLASGDFDWIGHGFIIAIIDSLDNYSNVYIDCYTFVVNQTEILLRNFVQSKTISKPKWRSGIYGNKKAVKSTTVVSVEG